MLELKNYRVPVPGKSDFVLEELELKEGERFQLKGASGSGKSLFLKSLVGFWPARYDSYHFQGEKVREPWSLRGKIAYVPGKMPLINIRVKEELERVGKFSPTSSFNPQEFLEVVNVPISLLERSTRQLSGGEEQIVYLMRALGCGPSLFVMDESFSAMDVELRQRCFDYLDSNCREKKASVLFVSHT